jgi:hypothetical protein
MRGAGKCHDDAGMRALVHQASITAFAWLLEHLRSRMIRYAWLNQRLCLAEGRLAGKDEIEYRVYRVI